MIHFCATFFTDPLFFVAQTWNLFQIFSKRCCESWILIWTDFISSSSWNFGEWRVAQFIDITYEKMMGTDLRRPSLISFKICLLNLSQNPQNPSNKRPKTPENSLINPIFRPFEHLVFNRKLSLSLSILPNTEPNMLPTISKLFTIYFFIRI